MGRGCGRLNTYIEMISIFLWRELSSLFNGTVPAVICAVLVDFSGGHDGFIQDARLSKVSLVLGTPKLRTMKKLN